MRTQRKICWLALLITLAGYGLSQVYAQDKTKKPAARQTGFKSIFNGKDLTGWEGDPAYWTVEDGAITGTTDGKLKANSFIVWRGGTVKNFELRVKVKITQGGNSGLQYRSAPFSNGGPYVLTGYQCDIVTTNDEYDGMLYDERGRRILAQAGTRVVIDPNNEKWIVGSVGRSNIFPLESGTNTRSSCAAIIIAIGLTDTRPSKSLTTIRKGEGSKACSACKSTSGRR